MCPVYAEGCAGAIACCYRLLLPSSMPLSMPSFRESAHDAAEAERLAPSLRVSVPVDLAVMAGTVPLLALVIGSRWLGEGMVELGKASEELFRGDRLPSRPLMTELGRSESSDDKKS